MASGMELLECKSAGPRGGRGSGVVRGGLSPYTAFSSARRWFLLVIVTAGGFSAPLAGNVYLPALLALERAFRVSTELINLTVGVFMLALTFSVSAFVTSLCRPLIRFAAAVLGHSG
jgi:hypothetical protein